MKMGSAHLGQGTPHSNAALSISNIIIPNCAFEIRCTLPWYQTSWDNSILCPSCKVTIVAFCKANQGSYEACHLRRATGISNYLGPQCCTPTAFWNAGASCWNFWVSLACVFFGRIWPKVCEPSFLLAYPWKNQSKFGIYNCNVLKYTQYTDNFAVDCSGCKLSTQGWLHDEFSSTWGITTSKCQCNQITRQRPHQNVSAASCGIGSQMMCTSWCVSYLYLKKLQSGHAMKRRIPAINHKYTCNALYDLYSLQVLPP